jgi:hypothetical protein
MPGEETHPGEEGQTLMAGRGKGRYADFAGGDSGKASPVPNITAEYIGDMVKAVIGAGDAVLIAATKDGGAVRITLMSGDEKQTTYLATAELVDEFAQGVTQHVTKYLT